MCTVSYIPPSEESGFILTSNRDEKIFRPALSPQLYLHGDLTLCYPKDPKAGGSWISINNQGRLCCLLNGGFVGYEKQAKHIKSRGQVLLGFASSDETILEYFETHNLSTVEPFTLIAIDSVKNGKMSFNEFVWDGEQKHYKVLDPSLPYLWSSVTLYSVENRELRRLWFNMFLKDNATDLTSDKVISFHEGVHTTDLSNNIVMEREDGLKTLSITQVIHIKNGYKMKHTDLIENFQNEVIL